MFTFVLLCAVSPVCHGFREERVAVLVAGYDSPWTNGQEFIFKMPRIIWE